jgi:radical SAM protein with 4Fe4S-binding SPASM domain
MIPWRNFRRFVSKTVKQPGYAFRVFLKRLSANFYRVLGNGRSAPPESLTLFLTHRCNLHCLMCGQWGEAGVTKKQGQEYIRQELTLDELKKLICDLSLFKPSITLFGGEPLLYPFCPQVIEYIKKKNLHCLMITNGSLLEEKAKELVKSGLDELNVSLDGAAELHDQIRGMPGLFDKIMRGIEQVNYFKRESGRSKPLINLQCTINKQNYMHLDQMPAVAKQANADSLTFHNLIFIDRKTLEKQKEYDLLLDCASSAWEGFLMEPGIDPKILYEKITAILSGKYRFNVDMYPNFSCSELNDYYGNPCYTPSEKSARCLSPWLVAYVFPDGQLRPCLNSAYSYGDIRKDDFSKVWNSEAAVKYRLLLKEKNIFPACARCTELYRY